MPIYATNGQYNGVLSCEKKHVVFNDPPTKTEANFAERETSLEACLQLTERHQDEQCERDFELLKNLLEKDAFEEFTTTGLDKVNGRKCLPSGTEEPSNTKEKLNDSLLVFVGMHSGADKRKFVRITDGSQGNLMQKLHNVARNYGVHFQFTIKNERHMCKNMNGTEYQLDQNGQGQWNAIGDIAQVSSDTLGSEGIKLTFLHNGSFNHWVQPANTKEHNMTLSITCIAYPNITVSIFSSISTSSRKNIFQTILDDEIKPDVSIRTKDNSEVKCHRSILSVQSDVLEKNFKGSYAESQTNIVEMIDMTTPGVKAFLAYLYYSNIEKAVASSTIAVEVFQASHKYNVSSLEEEMKRIIITKPDNWFDVEAALELFLFARNLENGDELKIRAVKLIKMNFASFETSPKYKELIKENHEAVMELFKIVCML